MAPPSLPSQEQNHVSDDELEEDEERMSFLASSDDGSGGGPVAAAKRRRQAPASALKQQRRPTLMAVAAVAALLALLLVTHRSMGPSADRLVPKPAEAGSGDGSEGLGEGAAAATTEESDGGPAAGSKKQPSSGPPGKEAKEEEKRSPDDDRKEEPPPPTTSLSDLPGGFKRPAGETSDTYLRRARGGSSYGGEKQAADVNKELQEKWGAWTFRDPDASKRPGEMPYADHPNRDVPRGAFPARSWQTDPDYLKRWLPEAIDLTERALEAILAEYGHGKDDSDEPFEKRAALFNVTVLPDRGTGKNPAGYNNKNPPNAGYTTPATLRAIRRRLLHSIMTEDTFTVAMGGHSAAAGHGNHFQQSYTLQVQRILEPVLARLGVYHKSHNFGMGGLGTIQNALGARDLYGTDVVDIMIWDSSMTENDGPSRDLFARSALLSGERVPVLWGEPDLGTYEAAVPGAGTINVCFWGSCQAGLPETTSAVQVKQVPWAARYLKCTGDEVGDLCKDNRFNGTCWIPRDDVTPPTKQQAAPGGRAKWHPGNRVHQLNGRAIAFQILRELNQGLKEWYNTPDYALPDDAWHVTDVYEKIRSKVAAMKSTACTNLNISNVTCTGKIRAKSEFTPRYNPAGSSIRSIMKEGVYVPEPKPNIYDPPETYIPLFDPPKGEVDVLQIIENGLDYLPNKARREAVLGQRVPSRQLAENRPKILEASKKSGIVPGQGWSLSTNSAPDNCDGSWDSFCGHSADNNCLLTGHNDYRGGLIFDGLSGWMILNLEKVKEGVIILGLYDWLGADSNPRTKGWKCENGATDCPGAQNASDNDDGGNNVRLLKGKSPPEKCDAYRFEFAIDGKITSWTKAQFDANRRQVQRVVHLFQLLDDPKYTNGKEKDVELAIRLTGCGRGNAAQLTHVYWA